MATEKNTGWIAAVEIENETVSTVSYIASKILLSLTPKILLMNFEMLALFELVCLAANYTNQSIDEFRVLN